MALAEAAERDADPEITAGPRPSLISSRTSRSGTATSAFASVSIFCSPPLSVPAFWPSRSPSTGK